MEVRPNQNQSKHLGFTGARGHFDDIARPVLRKHPWTHPPGFVQAKQVVLVFVLSHFVEVNNRLYSLALCKVKLNLNGESMKGGLSPKKHKKVRKWAKKNRDFLKDQWDEYQK